MEDAASDSGHYGQPSSRSKPPSRKMIGRKTDYARENHANVLAESLVVFDSDYNVLAVYVRKVRHDLTKDIDLANLNERCGEAMLLSKRCFLGALVIVSAAILGGGAALFAPGIQAAALRAHKINKADAAPTDAAGAFRFVA